MSDARVQPIQVLPSAAALVVACAIALSSRGSGEALAAVAALATGAVLLPLAPTLVALFVVLLLGLPYQLNEVPASFAGVNLYFADAILFFFAAAACFEAARGMLGRPYPERTMGERFMVVLVWASAAYGVIALARGMLVSGFEWRDAIGAYRRYCFYPLAFLVPLNLPIQRRHLPFLQSALALGAISIVFTALYSLANGLTYRPDIFIVEATEPDPRLLGYTACMTLAMGLSLFVAMTMQPGRIVFRAAAAGAIACTGALLISGWRLSVGLALAMPFAAISVMSLLRGGRALTQALTLCVGALFVTAAVAGTAFVLPDTWQRATLQFEQRVRDFDVTDDARYYSWKNAGEVWSESPILGAGLGRQAEFFVLGSEGTFYLEQMSTHNTFVGLLADSGLVGLLLALAFHASFVALMFRRRRDFAAAYRPLVTGIVVGYLAATGFSFLQPMQVSAIVSMHLLMGFAVLLCRPEFRQSRAPLTGS
ncbi:MAG: O-antigen ligase family protein [Candidatus Hydrogenedentota bacterium]